MIYKIMRTDPIRGDAVHTSKFYNGMAVHDSITNDSEWTSYKLLIPRAHARLETEERTKLVDLEKVECYEIRVFLQIGSHRSSRDTMVLCKFPNYDKYFRVNIHATGGASYDKSEHKFMLRVTDELDRRIILGFCQKYNSSLINASYSKSNKPDIMLQYNAADYTAKDMPIRLKSGPTGHRDLSFYHNLKPYEESYHQYNIFENVSFM